MMMKFLPTILATMTILFAANAVAAGDAASGKGKVAICVACHGQDGISATSLYPNLAGQGEKYLLKQLRDVKSGARNIIEMTGMLAMYDDQGLADIAAYYASLDAAVMGSASIEDAAYKLNATEFLAVGEQVFRGGNMQTGVAACTGCHSPTGKGNAPAAYPALGGQHSDYIIAQLQKFQNNLRTNDGEGMIMRAVAGPMSDLEIRAVANYLSGLH